MVNIAAETTMLDDGVGEVIATLKEEGFDDNTLVVYISDQGSSWGQHGIWGNSSWSIPGAAYDMNMQIPLIFHHPGKIKEGTRTDLIVNQFDFFPTLAAYAGLGDIEIANSPGRNYMPQLVGEDYSWGEQAAYYEFNATRAIRTHQWKYIKRIFNLPSELYDLTADPQESNNLINNKNYASTLQQLDKSLTDFFAKNSDPRYDLWKNGQSKGRSIDSGKVEKLSAAYPNFSQDYSNWTIPVQEKTQPFEMN